MADIVDKIKEQIKVLDSISYFEVTKPVKDLNNELSRIGRNAEELYQYIVRAKLLEEEESKDETDESLIYESREEIMRAWKEADKFYFTEWKYVLDFLGRVVKREEPKVKEISKLISECRKKLNKKKNELKKKKEGRRFIRGYRR